MQGRGDRPAPTGQFTGDRGVGLRAHLAPGIELLPGTVQAPVPVQRPDPGRGVDQLEFPNQPVAGLVEGSVMILGGLDEQAAGVRVPGLGDRSL